MSLADRIQAFMRDVGKPVTTRQIVDALPADTRLASVSSWLSIGMRLGIVQRVSDKRPCTYGLVPPGVGITIRPAPRATPETDTESPGPAPPYPPSEIHELRRRVNQSQLHMHLAIQGAIAAHLDQVIERITKDALRRYIDLYQSKERT